MMVNTRSMAEEDEEGEKREISMKVTQIMRHSETLEQKMDLMLALANALPNQDEKKDFVAFTETVQDDHQNLKKRLADFVECYHYDQGFEVAFLQLEAFMKQELETMDKLHQLCVKFLSEEDRNYLDFLSDEDDTFIVFRPLEPRRNEGFSRQPADKGKSKIVSKQESVEELEANKKDGLLKKSEGFSSSEHKEIEDENISKIQEQLQSSMLLGVSNEKNEEYEETSLKEWLKQPKNGSEDRNAPNSPRWSAIEIAWRSSLLLLDFMIIMSDQEHAMDKLRTFKATLRDLSQENDTLLMDKMVKVMEMVEKEAMEEKTKAGVSESKAEPQVDEFINLFFEILLHLENIIAFPSLPVSIKLMEGSESALESGLEQCNAQLKGVASMVDELKKLRPCDFESGKRASLEQRIVAMWDRVKMEGLAEKQAGNVECSYPMQLFLKM